jgi:hypothetical protein
MTSMEKETSRAFSVNEVAAACENLALHRIAELRVDCAPYAAGTEYSQLCAIK